MGSQAKSPKSPTKEFNWPCTFPAVKVSATQEGTPTTELDPKAVVLTLRNRLNSGTFQVTFVQNIVHMDGSLKLPFGLWEHVC